jgi:hypothetical protein
MGVLFPPHTNTVVMYGVAPADDSPRIPDFPALPDVPYGVAVTCPKGHWYWGGGPCPVCSASEKGTTLIPCPACNRHIHAGSLCPFCFAEQIAKAPSRADLESARAMLESAKKSIDEALKAVIQALK